MSHLMALDKIAGHDDDAFVRAGKLFRLLDVVYVPVMERIVFRDDSHNFHNAYSFVSVYH